jgi:hypothetical protein
MKILYYRAVARVAFLSVLAMALVIFAHPTSVQAFTCQSDCRAAYNNCLAACSSLPAQPTEGCPSFCLPDYSDCLSTC